MAMTAAPRHQQTELLALANLSGSVELAELEDAAGWRSPEVLISNYRGVDERFDAAGVSLRPWEALVLRHRRPWRRDDRTGASCSTFALVQLG